MARQTYVGAEFYETFPVFAPGATGGKISGFTAGSFQTFEFWNGQNIDFQPTIFEATGTGQYFTYLPTGFPTAGMYVVQVIDPVGEVWGADVEVASGPINELVLTPTVSVGYPTGSAGYALSGLALNPLNTQSTAQVSFTYSSSTLQLFGNAWCEINGQFQTAASAVINVYNNSGVLQGTVSVPSPDTNGVFDFTISDLSFTTGELLYTQAIITLISGPVVTSVKGMQVL